MFRFPSINARIDVMKQDAEPYVDWWLKQSASRQDETIDLKGVKLFVSKEVFSPRPDLTHSTTFMLDFIDDLEGKTVLDLGSGTGIIALYAAKHGAAQVTATDLDEAALKNIQLNIDNAALGDVIQVVKSDLFNQTPGRFDVITGNLPTVGKHWNQTRDMVVNLYRRLFDQYALHLNPGGRFYFSFTSFGDEAWLFQELKTRKINYDMLSTDKFGETWYVFKIDA